MSTPKLSSEQDEFEVAYEGELLQARLFGAIRAAATYRKSAGYTGREISKRACMNETALSRFFVEPTNCKIATVAALAYALDVRFEFALVAKEDPGLTFLDSGPAGRSYISSTAVAHQPHPDIKFSNLLSSNAWQEEAYLTKAMVSEVAAPEAGPSNYVSRRR